MRVQPGSPDRAAARPSKGAVGHVALLRGINVGGHKQVSMTDLRSLLSALGFAGAQSLLQSGNLVFPARSQSRQRLERLLEKETGRRLGIDVDFFVRTTAEWSEIVDGNPFRDEARRDPGHLLVLFLKETPEARNVKALQEAINGPEVVRASGSSHAYIVYPDGVGRSRLTHAVIERKLGVRGTARNWNTVVKLQALVSAVA